MYIKRVVLESIKAIEKCDLDLCPDGETYAGWCVVTGDNGVGKTALLKAIGLALLGPDQARGLLPDLRGWISDGASRGTVSVEVKPDHDHDKTQRGGYPTQSTFWAEIEFTPDGPTTDIGSADIFRNKKKSAVNGPWAQSTTGWLALGYGPFRRLYGSSPDAQRLMVIPGRIPRFATLYKEDATLSECEEWVKQLNYKQLERRPDETLALSSLLRLLNNDFLRQNLRIDRVDSDGIWLRDDLSRVMPLSDMSEGYRAALAMLIDIFRHMVLTYGPAELVIDTGDDCFVSKPAVVLIDEVDAHLHPAWQREIGFWLTKHFPSVQFIVTTHSPLVCQAADTGRIYHIPQASEGPPFRLDESSYERVITGKPDEILLSPAFGMPHTRSPRAVQARERHARLTAKKLASGQLEFDEMRELAQLNLFADA